MKFKIKHSTKLFYWYRDFFLLVPVGIILLYVACGITLNEQIPAYIFYAATIVFGGIYVILYILNAIEYFTGAKITVNDDHLDIRMLLRHKKIYYDQITDIRYSHFTQQMRSHRNRHLIFRRRVRYRNRALLEIFLSSGKCVSLNDVPTGYKEKLKLQMIMPFNGINVDEDVILYQAYQCYRATVGL